MQIALDHPIQIFDDHFNKHGNERILFSAPFGYGKTYFLDHFFKQNQDRYRPFWLSPIKYVVGQNEDIFEYIKLDIALQLTAIEELQGKSSPRFGEDLYIDQYLRNNPLEVSRLLIETIKDLEIPVIKRGIAFMLKAFEARDKYIKWKDNLKKELESDTEKILKHGLLEAKVRGSIFEDDTITQIIRCSLEGVKEVTKRQNILIIDDFDRLDPEHIFRILNILSVHQNYHGNENKFGFDKIIIVCSIDNIKKIFEHRYGKGVGFEGYMEKFYSTDIFHFNNQLAISYFCRTSFSVELDEDCVRILGTLLAYFVDKKDAPISIRSIVKYERVSPIRYFKFGPFLIVPDPATVADLPIENKQVGVHIDSIKNEFVWGKEFSHPIKESGAEFFIDSNDFPFLKVIQILSTIFGDYNSFFDAIKLASEDKTSFDKGLSPTVMRSLAALYHVVERIDYPQDLFCKLTKNSTPHVPAHNYKIVSTPSNDSLRATIDVGWGDKMQYDGKVSYYSNVNDLAKKEAFALSTINSFGVFATYILGICTFLENKGLLANLGLTK